VAYRASHFRLTSLVLRHETPIADSAADHSI